MERIFLELFNRAICAGWLVLAILVLRVVLKKVPKWVRCLLWAMVAVRLLVPIQIESPASLIPSAETVSPDMMYAKKPELHTGIGVMNSAFNPMLSDYLAPKPENSVNPLQVIAGIASWVWLAGVVFMLIWAAVSYVRLRLLVRTAVLVKTRSSEDGEALSQELSEAHGVLSSKIPVMESEHVDSPFVIGLFRPRIYLPVKLKDADRDFIISHETAHIHRKDHWVKPFGYLLLAVYWFHPLLWAAYIMLCRDIEYACDERVVKQYNVEERKAYSTALLACSVRRMRIAACPVAFGEVGVRKRVKSVLHYKKPAFWVLIAAAVGCTAVAVCFLTNPQTDEGERTETDGGAQEANAGNGSGDSADGAANAGNGDAAGGDGINGEGSGDGAQENEMQSGDGAQGEGGWAEGPADMDSAAGIAVPADGSYVFDHCVFMNPLSSYFPQVYAKMGGVLDADGLLWNEYGQQERFDYQQAPDEADVDTMPWAVFEAEELKSLLYAGWQQTQFEEVDTVLEEIAALPESKRLWRPLTGGGRLLYVNEELWFLRDSGDCVWSIYALRPQGDALSEAVEKAVLDWAEEKDVFGGVTKSGAAAEGVTGELWATYPCVSFFVLGTEEAVDAETGAGTVTVYAQVLCAAYLCEQTGITDLGGCHVPAAVTFLVGEDGSYTLLEYWTPRDGSYFVQDIREKCPDTVADAMIDGQRYIDALMQDSYTKALAETGVVDTWSVVEGLLERMLFDEDGILKEDADAAERMAVYPLTVRELTYYGEDTLRYLYSQFMQGGENGLKGELMARVMHELICKEIQLRMPLTDGQAYFDALCECARANYEDLIVSQGGEAQAERYMREYMPAQRLLLQMLNVRTGDAEAGVQADAGGHAAPEDSDTQGTDDGDGRADYEYYLTKEELLSDIGQGSIFRLDTTFRRTSGINGGNQYPAPFVSLGNWPFYVHEDNMVNLEVSFSNLIRKPKESVFPMEERVMVDVISPDGQSVYRFEKSGGEITEDTFIKEQIAVTPGEWTLQVSFAYVCGEQPAHLRIAAFYETPSKEDKDWLIEERLADADAV